MPTASLVDRYARILTQLQPLLAETSNRVSRMATAAALLHNKMPHFFWTGFYLVDGDDLVVGPYQGTLACLVLPRGVGVCWAGVRERRAIIVPNVHEFPGHVACDSRSRSEIVVPLVDGQGNVWGVLDVDSTRLNAFSETDRAGLEKIVGLL